MLAGVFRIFNLMSEQSPTQQNVNDWLSRQESSDRLIDLSIVIPAYNEQWRLPTTLIDIIDYIDERKINAEVIVVDDGSSDSTCDAVRKFERIRPCLRLL